MIAGLLYRHSRWESVRVHDHVDANTLLVERKIFLLNDQTGHTFLSVTRTETNFLINSAGWEKFYILL
jgi:hypothetical protein